MTKLFLIVIIAVISAVFIGFPHSFSDSSPKTTVLVRTDKTSYNIGDTVLISGSVTNPISDKIVLKMFNSKAELVWLFQVNLDTNNTFQTTLQLSDPTWNGSAFYVLTAKTNDTVGATSFEINQTSSIQRVITTTTLGTVEEFLQKNYSIPIAGILIIGAAIYLRSSRSRKSTTGQKPESLSLITLDAPSPAKVQLSHGKTMSYEGWKSIPEDQRPEINSVEFWIGIKNIGGNDAKNIAALFLQKDEILSRQDMEKNESGQVSLPDLIQGEFYYWNFEISLDRFVRLNQRNLFVGLLISYDNYKTRGHSGMIFEIGDGGGYILDEWFVH